MLSVAEACFLTMKDPKVSMRNKSLLLASLVYFVTPIDAIPDFVPGGYTDDLSVLMAALLATGIVGKQHLEKCRIKNGLKAQNNEDEFATEKTQKKSTK